MRGLLVATGFLCVAARVSTAQLESDTRALTRFQERKAEALLRSALPCLGCHRLNGEGGRIGPDLSTVGQRRSVKDITAMIDDPQGTVPGTAMPRVKMPHATRELIIRYLASRTGTVAPAPIPISTAAAPAADRRDGGSLYGKYCAACHGTSGRGDAPNAGHLPVKPARHASREAMALRSDAALFDVIAGGGAVMGRSPRMPPFGATLSRSEITLLVRHIRELCRCRGPSWSTDGTPDRPGSTKR
jgi:mono/diheme cytochrome c family protein